MSEHSQVLAVFLIENHCSELYIAAAAECINIYDYVWALYPHDFI